ncbi:RDD family protein [Flavobacterium sp. 316]|uniref:RDD family protein n=1 Tax=Flavobacterium sp. 316 TaxID=1603293 RepID=UPI0005FA1D9C|nr:RDD family protein [Flavobacterium sp. 316]
MEVSKLNRFLALFIDGLVLAIPSLILGLLAGIVGGMSWLIYIVYILQLGYILFKDALFGGQSIGKKIMKYKAVKEDGSSLDGDFMTSLMRNVTIAVPLLNLFEAFLVITDKPRLGDNIAKTKVVNV